MDFSLNLVKLEEEEEEPQVMDQEKRMRREIANSNERRRMQSINAGFAGLRNLLPNHEGEKLSKAAILQQTSDYIYQLLQEKNKLVAYNNQLKRIVAQAGGDPNVASYSSPQSPANDPPAVTKRRKTVDGSFESADEGIGSMSPEHSMTSDEARAEILDLRREAMEARLAFERERRHRISLEEHIAILQQQSGNYTRRNELDRMQTDDIDPFPITTNRIVQDETPRCYTVRNNLQTIVEAIRHLEGDHLFSDDRTHSTPSSSPPSAAVVTEASTTIPVSPSQTTEVPLALTATLSSNLPAGATYIVASGPSSGTSLKHHTITTPPVSRTVEIEDQPINLEFRPGLSRSPSPFNNQGSPSNQQQHRPGVIVVKHA